MSSKLLWSVPRLAHGTWLSTRGHSWLRLHPDSGYVSGWTRFPFCPKEGFDVPFDLALMMHAAQLSMVLGLTWEYHHVEPSHILTARGGKHHLQLGSWLIDSRGTFTGHLIDPASLDWQVAFQHGRFELERQVEARFATGTLAWEPPTGPEIAVESPDPELPGLDSLPDGQGPSDAL